MTDPQGAVLPGVTVTLTGPRGAQSVVSDGEGVYRFVGVQPATYSLKSELAGFVLSGSADRRRRHGHDRDRRFLTEDCRRQRERRGSSNGIGGRREERGHGNAV